MIYLGPISSVPDYLHIQRIALDDVSKLSGWNTPSKWLLLFATRVDVYVPTMRNKTVSRMQDTERETELILNIGFTCRPPRFLPS